MIWCSPCPSKKEYIVQILKCLCSGLNRFFKKTRGIDITSDVKFVKANEMFGAVKVNARKQVLGVKKSYPLINLIDLEQIAECFCMTKETFKLIVKLDVTEYFTQHIDEMDKNHGVKHTNKSNEGKMYATNSKLHTIFHLLMS